MDDTQHTAPDTTVPAWYAAAIPALLAAFAAVVIMAATAA